MSNNINPAENITAKYSIATRIIHWAMALIIISLIVSGFTKDYWPKDMQGSFYYWHKSFGTLIFFLFFLRLIIRSFTKRPEMPSSIARKFVIISACAFVALYILMLIMPLSGIFMSDAGNYPVSFFGLFNLPDLPEKDKAIGSFFHSSHFYLGIMFSLVVLAHIGGTIFHLVKDKENLLKRII